MQQTFPTAMCALRLKPDVIGQETTKGLSGHVFLFFKGEEVGGPEGKINKLND